MPPLFRATTLAAALAVPGLVASSRPAMAYPIDCAILLCLAGGWPSSAPCAAAWAEFIRRITPFPIEPPLQIWRCPMGVSFEAEPQASSLARLIEAAVRFDPRIGKDRFQSHIVPVQSREGADVDISGSAFDFVRSIRVFHIEYSQYEGRDDCIIRDATRLGTYGEQGDYRWSRARIGQIPPASDFAVPSGCNPYAYRAVFVDWSDSSGAYGFEEVRY